MLQSYVKTGELSTILLPKFGQTRTLSAKWDEFNPMSRFMLHIFGAFAEFEREMIRERTVSGVRAAKAKGKWLGRPAGRSHAASGTRPKLAVDREAVGVPVSTVIDSSRSTVFNTEG